MTLEPVEMSGEAYDNFVSSLKSPATRTAYEKALRHYMKFLKISNFAELLGGELKLVQARIISYVMEHRNNALSTSIIEQRLSAIKGFYSTNDVVLNWDKIYSYMGQRTKKGRAIVEVDTDGGYVMSEDTVEENDKVKTFDKFIGDLETIVKKKRASTTPLDSESLNKYVGKD